MKPALGIYYAGPKTFYPQNISPDIKVHLGSDTHAGSCDLIVMADPDKRSVARMYSSMQPGAYIYIEWTANIFTKTDQFISTLNTQGFEEINLYLPKPENLNSLPRIYIPLDDSGVIEYMMNEYHLDSTVKIFKKALISLRSFLWKKLPSVFLSYPWLLSKSSPKYTLCSIARKPLKTLSNINNVQTPNKKIGQLISLSDRLKEGWERWELGKVPQKLSILIICRGKSYYTKLILFIFSESKPVPTLVIKLPISIHANTDCDNEEYVLKTLNEKYRQIEGVPRLIFSDNNTGSKMISQMYIDATPLNKIINNSNFRELAISITSWLIALAKNTKVEPQTDWNNTTFNQVVSDLDSCMGTLLKAGTIENTYKVLNEFEIPFLVCEHRDLKPTNVNINNEGKIGVVDWENSRFNGIPALDLIFILTHICIHYSYEPSDTFADKHRKMLDPNTFTGATFSDCIERYFSELNIPYSFIDSLRLLTWIFQSHLKSLDLTTGNLYRPSKLSEGTRFAVDLWELEVNHKFEKAV